MESQKQFQSLIQMGPAEIRLRQSALQSPIAKWYSQILLAYYEADLDRLLDLQQLISQLGKSTSGLSDEELRFLKMILPLRISIRTCTVDLDIINKIEWTSERLGLFDAELNFVLAMAYEILKMDHQASRLFDKSYQLFTELGALSKAGKALHNKIAAESRLEENRFRIFISDYLQSYELSKKQNDLMTAGMALTNVSKEFHRLGHLKNATRFALKSVRVLEKEINSYNFHLANLNLIQLLIESKKYSSAAENLQLIEHSPYPDVQESIKALHSLIHQTRDAVDKSKLPQNWILKLEQKNQLNLDKFSTHEQSLIELLALRPRSKDQLIDSIYGSQIDPFSAEQRFKNLLNRLKKKSPGIIEVKNNLYYLRNIA